MKEVTDYTGILAINAGPGFRWNAHTKLGTPVIVTYSFADGDNVPTVEESAYSVTSTSDFTDAQRDNFRKVVEHYEQSAGIKLDT